MTVSKASSPSSRCEASSGTGRWSRCPMRCTEASALPRTRHAGRSWRPPILGRERRADYIELRHRRPQGLELPMKSLYVTFSRAISADEDVNARAIPGKQRRMTRQGLKHGLRAEVGREHVDAVYDIYAPERSPPRLTGLPAAAVPCSPRSLRQGLRGPHGLASGPDRCRCVDALPRGPGPSVLRRCVARRPALMRRTTSCTGS